jgi:serine/threonine-protein kinase
VPERRPADTADRLVPGSRLGVYEVGRHLGSGGMGSVYEGVHTRLGKRVALKVLRRSVAHNTGFIERFLREGEAASSIRHPHVVDVHDVSEQDGLPYLVMEYLEGQSLARRIREGGALSLPEVAAVMLPVLSAVAAAHDAGIVHRDLKPENILLTIGPHGHVHPKVLDFGISKVSDKRDWAQLTGTSALLGTPSYMSPEQIERARQVGPAADQYSIGVMLYECVTGKRPFEGDSLIQVLSAIGRGLYTAPRELLPGLAPAIEAAIRRAMALNPEDRFATVRHLGQALLPFAEGATAAVWSPEFENPVAGAAPVESDDTRIAVSEEPPMPDAEAAPGATTGPWTPPSTPPARGGDTVSVDPGRMARAAASPAHSHDTVPEPRPRRRRGAGIAIGAVVVLGAAAAAAVVVAWPDQPAPVPGPAAAPAPAPAPRTFPVEVRTTPPEALLELDGEAAGRGELSRELPIDGTTHRLRVSADGHREQVVVFRDAPPPGLVILDPVAATAPPAGPPVAAPPPEEEPPADRRPARRPVQEAEPAAPAAAARSTERGANRSPILE